VDKVKTTIQTYDAIAEEFYKNHFDINSVKNLADDFIKELKGKNILDIGCGPGRDAKYFSDNGFNVVGIDLSDGLLKIARQLPNIKFLKMDMRKLSFKENIFDGIWACASFLHVPKTEAKHTLIGFKKVLKPGGVIFICVQEGKEEKFVSQTEHKGAKKFFAFYSENELRNLIEECDLKILKTVIQKKKDTWINIFAKKFI